MIGPLWQLPGWAGSVWEVGTMELEKVTLDMGLQQLLR